MIHTGFRTGSYATIWDVQPKGKFTQVRLSVSRKNQQTGEYEQDFSGFCMFISAAHAKAEKLRPRDRIRLKDIDVSTTYDKAQNKEYVNYKVFDFDFADNGSPAATASAASSGVNPVDSGTADEEPPF